MNWKIFGHELDFQVSLLIVGINWSVNWQHFFKNGQTSRKPAFREGKLKNLPRTRRVSGVTWNTGSTWPQATSAAPVEDLQYCFLMEQYKQHDEQLAVAVIQSCKRHLWYLCEELAVLRIFNEVGSYILCGEHLWPRNYWIPQDFLNIIHRNLSFQV